MIAAEATLKSAVSTLREFAEYVLALFLLLAEKWTRMLQQDEYWNASSSSPALDISNMVAKETPPPINIKTTTKHPTITERSVPRQPPRKESGAVMPRTMSTRKAVHLKIGTQTHRRCTSGSGVTTTTSAVSRSLHKSLSQLQTPPLTAAAPSSSYAKLSERESLAVALRCAVIRKEVKSIKALLEDKRDLVAHILTQWSDSFHSSIIHTAAATANAAVVSELLAQVPESDLKSVVNCRGPQNQTALHIACTKQSLDICKILLQKGADPNSCTRQDTRPLHLATGVGDYDLCKVLLEHGAETNCISKVGCIPLLTAVELRNQAIVALMLEFGANPRLSSETGLSARALALRMNDKQILETIDVTIKQKNNAV